MGRQGHARVVVLAVIEEEVDAVRDRLEAHHEVSVTGAMTAVPVDGEKPRLPFVLIRSQGRSLAPTIASATKAIEDWRPEVVVLVGIAGGIRRGTQADDGEVAWDDGPEPGDIVMASYIHYAEYTKNVRSGTQLRHYALDQPSSTLVQQHGDALRHAPAGAEAWHVAMTESRPEAAASRAEPMMFIGEIIHVEGLAGDPANAHQRWYLERFDHAIALDMESIGVARALHDARVDVHYNPVFLCVRAISDRVWTVAKDSEHEAGDNNAERAACRAYATDSLGCFVRRLVGRLVAGPRPPGEGDPGTDAFNGWIAG